MTEVKIHIIDQGANLQIIKQRAPRQMFYGFPMGGGMDQISLNKARSILKPGNPFILEAGLKAPKIRFEEKLRFVIIGSDMNWKLDGKKLMMDKVYSSKKESILTGGFSRNGLRSYIAFAGERKHNHPSNNSNSYTLHTYPIKASKNIKKEATMDLAYLTIHRGPEWPMLSQESKEQLMYYDGILTQDLDRSGAYLEGANIYLDQDFPKKSVCTFPGVIQLLPSGQLIVLLQDGQNTGGYPRVAYLKKEDLSIFNQLLPGSKFKFRIKL